MVGTKENCSNVFRNKFCELSEINQKYIVGLTQALIFSQNQSDDQEQNLEKEIP